MNRLDNVIVLDERYDSSNAEQMEKELFAYLTPEDKEITLDASALQYISSAGLRVLMKLKKSGVDITMTEVSRDVYDVLDMTGFAKLMQIERALRTISVEGAEEIGHGFSSTVYRIDRDTLVKVYNKRIPLWKIRREGENAKKAFFFGIQTMISYDIVKVGGWYGAVFELVDSEVLSRFLNNHPEQFEEYCTKYIKLLKDSHATEVDDTFIDVKPLWHSWIDMLAPYLREGEAEVMHKLVSAVPDRNTFIHSDIHVNNIVTRDGELVLIDMADIGRGHPIFDIGPICFHYLFLEQADPNLADNLIVLNHNNRLRLWERIENEYLYDPDPVRHDALVKIYKCIGAMRCGLIAAKHAQMEPEQKEMFVSTMRRFVFDQADEVLQLMAKYL